MPDAERAAEHREQREIDADRLQREQHADHEQQRAHDLGEHDAHVDVERVGAA